MKLTARARLPRRRQPRGQPPRSDAGLHRQPHGGRAWSSPPTRIRRTRPSSSSSGEAAPSGRPSSTPRIRCSCPDSTQSTPSSPSPSWRSGCWRAGASGDVFERSLANRAEAEVWSFYEGPPTANGRPGSHHVLARVFKDVYPRYKTMCGYRVPRKAGWDCHGLPVELEVEKQLGIASKQEIEEFGIAEFNQRCRESVFEYVEEWNRLTERIGFWIDLDDPYVTLEDDYIESVWWSLRKLWDEEPPLRGPQGRPLLPALRHRALLARGRAGIQGRRGPLHIRALPAARRRRRGRRIAAGLDDDPVDPARQRRRRRRARRHLRTGRGRRRDPDPGRAAGREGAGRGSADRSTGSPGSDLVGRRYEGPVFDLSDREPRRLPGHRRRLRHHRGRHRPRPHRPRLRRRRLRGRRRQRALRPDPGRHPLQPGRPRRQLRPARHRLRGPLRQGPRGDPRADRRPRAPRPALPRAGLRARLPALLALRHAAPLLREVELVRRHLAGARAAARQQRDDRLAPRARQARPLRQMAGEQRRLGALAATATGARRCRSGSARGEGCDGRFCAGSVAELRERSGGAVPDDLHRPYIDEVTVELRGLRRRDAPGRVGDRHLVRQRRDALRPVPLPVRERGGVRGALPGRLHLRGPGPDPRLVLHAAGRVDAAVRRVELPQLRLPRPDPRPRGPEDVEEPRQRRRRPGT